MVNPNLHLPNDGRPPMSHDIDTPLDRTVDTQGISYAEARARLGLDSDQEAPGFTERDKARANAHMYYEQEFRLTGDIDRSPEAIAERQDIAAIGRPAVDSAFEAARQKK